MKIRELRFNRAMSFPPSWIATGERAQVPTGNVGVLRTAEWIPHEQAIRLTMEWAGAQYPGLLRVTDPEGVLPAVYRVLVESIGRTIAEIAEFDVPGVTEAESRD